MQPTRYRIVIRGQLSASWAESFGGFSLRAARGMTTMVGEVTDQAHLHGLLAQIRDLGIDLVSVQPVRTPAAPRTASLARDGRAP